MPESIPATAASSPPYLVLPPLEAYQTGQAVTGYEKYCTYSNYNYLRGGPIARIKRARFEKALQLAAPWFDKYSALDVGCGDGFLFPSLSRHFRSAVGIDQDEENLNVGQRVSERLGLQNITTRSSRGVDFVQLKAALPPADYRVAFILETLEHVGPNENETGVGMYAAKIRFIDGIFSLLGDDGVIIASVPKMVGLPFLIKYSTQMALRIPTEKMSVGEALKAGLLSNTDSLEPRWHGGHLGFNHLKLERELERHYQIVAKPWSIVTAFYVLRRKK